MKKILIITSIIFICIAAFHPTPAMAGEFAPPDFPPESGGKQHLPRMTTSSPRSAMNQPPGVEFTPFQRVSMGADPGWRRALKIESAKVQTFAASVADSRRKGVVVGVFAPGAFAAPVVQQPSSNPVYVSAHEDEVTQFRTAEKAGSIGLLAHNYLQGKTFFQLEAGSRLHVVYGDGRTEAYQVYAIKDYQALTLYTFRDLETQTSIGQYPLFDQIYRAEGDRVVLQTCIQKGNNLIWGRRFILAKPVPWQEQLLEMRQALYFAELAQ